MGFSKEKAIKIMGELIEDHSNDKIWDEIIQLMNKTQINFSPYMIYGEDFDSFNTILILDLDRDIELRFIDKEELLEFLKDEKFITYVNLYKNYCDRMKENGNSHNDDFNLFIKNLSM